MALSQLDRIKLEKYSFTERMNDLLFCFTDNISFMFESHTFACTDPLLPDPEEGWIWMISCTVIGDFVL